MVLVYLFAIALSSRTRISLISGINKKITKEKSVYLLRLIFRNWQFSCGSCLCGLFLDLHIQKQFKFRLYKIKIKSKIRINQQLTLKMKYLMQNINSRFALFIKQIIVLSKVCQKTQQYIQQIQKSQIDLNDSIASLLEIIQQQFQQSIIYNPYFKEIMFGSLKQFIEVQLPLIQSKIPTEQNQQQPNQIFFLNDQHAKKRDRIYSNIQDYQPSNKAHILTKFNQKNNFNKKTASGLDNPTSQSYKHNNVYHSQNKKRKPLYQHTSFFSKNQITKDYIAKAELKRKHNLLRAIVRTNQNQNQNEGVSDYDQSFKRLYERFKSIHAKPILQYRNFVIDQIDQKPSSHLSIQVNNKPVSSLTNRKRIQYENCLSWARKHKKKSQFYENQLGKHSKQKRQQIINFGHSLMPQVQKKIKNFSYSFRFDQSN